MLSFEVGFGDEYPRKLEKLNPEELLLIDLLLEVFCKFIIEFNSFALVFITIPSFIISSIAIAIFSYWFIISFFVNTSTEIQATIAGGLVGYLGKVGTNNDNIKRLIADELAQKVVTKIVPDIKK